MRPATAVALFILLASVYMISWSGRINSNDELLLLNATASLVRFGDMRADLAAGSVPPAPGDLRITSTDPPLPDIRVEPLQPVLAAPLYWLALLLPGVGLAHSVYLFNVLVSAAAGALFYLYARSCGYSEAAAVLASATLGLATIVWPYSDSFFQAPLALFMILLAGYQLERLRQQGWSAPVPILLALATLILFPLAHQSTLLALPALLIIALPERSAWRAFQKRNALLALLLLLILAVILVTGAGFQKELQTVFRHLGRLNLAEQARRIHSYLISPGGSLWGTSPVLLLALPGSWMLWRERRARQALAGLVMALVFALASAIYLDHQWFGGLSWPPRFLVPVVPFLLLAAMPVFERLTRRSRSRGLVVLASLLVTYSVWVQISGVSLPWEAYGVALPPESGGYGDWGGGMNELRWLRQVVIPGLWGQQVWDFAWLRMGAPAWPLLFGATATLAALQIRTRMRPEAESAGSSRLTTLVLLPAMLLTMLMALALLPPDPLYDSPNEDVASLLDDLPQLTRPDDMVLLNDLELAPWLVNYGKFTRPRLVSLPFHPGEMGSPEQQARIVSDNPEVLLQGSAIQQITALAGTGERLWLLAGNGPWLPWSVRPVERFLARNHYPLREFEGGPRARLIEYDTSIAPDPLLPAVPDNRAELRYGEQIQLIGYNLPRGHRYMPGETLPLSLFWVAGTTIEDSWTVAWFLARPDSPPAVQGWDSAPQAGFLPTTDWPPGVTQLDNRALRLPEDLPVGDYRILVVLYRVEEGGELVRLPVEGGQTRDGQVGLLPTTIQVGQGE
ncbi:MAG: hypothetical protein OXP68_11285 [Anaerolineaceae bacterium]|nr:hypothetical protein [Anaerolineaceae bacterium]MDE0329299.1 hypothetical protein [Anaerolineaceae bacterium]